MYARLVVLVVYRSVADKEHEANPSDYSRRLSRHDCVGVAGVALANTHGLKSQFGSCRLRCPHPVIMIGAHNPIRLV